MKYTHDWLRGDEKRQKNQSSVSKTYYKMKGAESVYDAILFKPRIVLPPNLFQSEGELLPVRLDQLALNDGLTLKDWLDWFKEYDLTKPMAIIHFTKNRYLKQ